MNFTFGLPREFVLVGEDGGGDGGAVVAAPSHLHEPHLGDLPLCSERHGGRARGSLEISPFLSVISLCEIVFDKS